MFRSWRHKTDHVSVIGEASDAGGVSWQVTCVGSMKGCKGVVNLGKHVKEPVRLQGECRRKPR